MYAQNHLTNYANITRGGGGRHARAHWTFLHLIPSGSRGRAIVYVPNNALFRGLATLRDRVGRASIDPAEAEVWRLDGDASVDDSVRRPQVVRELRLGRQ